MSVTTAAARAWRMAITVALLPIFLSSSIRNSFPIAKAIKPRAVSETDLKAEMFSAEQKPTPSIPKEPIR